jgi:glycosyltransferase involved in cell wall biosynthesis
MVRQSARDSVRGMNFVFVNIMIGMYRGGGENFDLHLSRELAETGHDVEFHFLQPVFGSPRLALPAYGTSHPVRAPWLYLWTQRLHGLPVIGRMRGVRGFPRWLGQAIFEFRVLFRLWRRRHETFVVHICGLSFLSMLATRLLGQRVFVRLPGPPSFRMHLWCIKNTHGVVANGDAFDHIRRLVPEANLLQLDVGVDHSLFQRTGDRAAAREALGLPTGKVLALFVGRLIALKNVQMLIRAMMHVAKERADVDLAIVGTGPERESLEQLSSHYDNFPNVVIEAMAMELPVVATRVGGIPSQVLDGRTGYLVAPDDDRGMATRILSLAREAGTRTAFGKEAASVARRRYDWARTAEHFTQFATRTLESRGV